MYVKGSHFVWQSRRENISKCTGDMYGAIAAAAAAAAATILLLPSSSFAVSLPNLYDDLIMCLGYIKWERDTVGRHRELYRMPMLIRKKYSRATRSVEDIKDVEQQQQEEGAKSKSQRSLCCHRILGRNLSLVTLNYSTCKVTTKHITRAEEERSIVKIHSDYC